MGRLGPTDDVKVAHPKNHTMALSTGIKANYPRLRDGCSGQRVKLSIAVPSPSLCISLTSWDLKVLRRPP
ncbi:hypothetical protein TNCV_4148651 [Trichonephila clavipes]|nr:hypothetical protein TNCV_4148651 [Trichonephila clavipes]